MIHPPQMKQYEMSEHYSAAGQTMIMMNKKKMNNNK